MQNKFTMFPDNVENDTSLNSSWKLDNIKEKGFSPLVKIDKKNPFELNFDLHLTAACQNTFNTQFFQVIF